MGSGAPIYSTAAQNTNASSGLGSVAYGYYNSLESGLSYCLYEAHILREELIKELLEELDNVTNGL